MAEIMATAVLLSEIIIIGTLLRRLILIPITEAVKLKEILDKPRTIPLTSMIAKGEIQKEHKGKLRSIITVLMAFLASKEALRYLRDYNVIF